MSPSPCSFTTALDESFALTVSLSVISCSTSTSLLFSRVGNPFLTTAAMTSLKMVCWLFQLSLHSAQSIFHHTCICHTMGRPKCAGCHIYYVRQPFCPQATSQ